jgi:hypothetical protein
MRVRSRIAATIVLLLAIAFGVRTAADDPALSLRAKIAGLPADSSAAASTKAETSAKVGGAASPSALMISVSRWSTDAERTPLLAAFAAPPPAPARPAAPAAPAAAGGRGRGRGAPPPPPPSPLARVSAAIKAAPTIGYIWTDGVTGYSIKYAWHSPAIAETERIVLITERRLDSQAPDWAPPSNADEDANFTVIEMRLDRQGVGEGKTSLTTKVAIDTDANTLALDGYAAAPALLKVTR